MTLEQYPWDLEERVEDAIVAYLKTRVTRIAMIIPARTVVEAKYPLVVVQAQSSNNKNDTAPFTGKRAMDVVVAMVIEAINNNGDESSPEYLEEARDTFRAIKSELIGCIAGNDLHDELNNVGVGGVEFSHAHMTAQTSDAGSGKITLEQTIEVIAQPKEL